MILNASIVPETSGRNSVILVHLPPQQRPSCLASLITGAVLGVLAVVLPFAMAIAAGVVKLSGTLAIFQPLVIGWNLAVEKLSVMGHDCWSFLIDLLTSGMRAQSDAWNSFDIRQQEAVPWNFIFEFVIGLTFLYYIYLMTRFIIQHRLYGAKIWSSGWSDDFLSTSLPGARLGNALKCRYATTFTVILLITLFRNRIVLTDDPFPNSASCSCFFSKLGKFSSKGGEYDSKFESVGLYQSTNKHSFNEGGWGSEFTSSRFQSSDGGGESGYTSFGLTRFHSSDKGWGSAQFGSSFTSLTLFHSSKRGGWGSAKSYECQIPIYESHGRPSSDGMDAPYQLYFNPINYLMITQLSFNSSKIQPKVQNLSADISTFGTMTFEVEHMENVMCDHPCFITFNITFSKMMHEKQIWYRKSSNMRSKAGGILIYFLNKLHTILGSIQRRLRYQQLLNLQILPYQLTSITHIFNYSNNTTARFVFIVVVVGAAIYVLYRCTQVSFHSGELSTVIQTTREDVDSKEDGVEHVEHLSSEKTIGFDFNTTTTIGFGFDFTATTIGFYDESHQTGISHSGQHEIESCYRKSSTPIDLLREHGVTTSLIPWSNQIKDTSGSGASMERLYYYLRIYWNLLLNVHRLYTDLTAAFGLYYLLLTNMETVL